LSCNEANGFIELVAFLRYDTLENCLLIFVRTAGRKLGSSIVTTVTVGDGLSFHNMLRYLIVRGGIMVGTATMTTTTNQRTWKKIVDHQVVTTNFYDLPKVSSVGRRCCK
jgi:hypothetical protein